MSDQPKYAYLYDKQNKIETICSVNQKHNYWEAKTDAEKIARKVLPKNIEEYHLLEVKKQMPFGSFLSDILSINFLYDPLFMQGRAKTVDDLLYWLLKLEKFLKDISLQYLWVKLSPWEDNKDDVKRLYMIRKYIDMCIERPRLYSFGQFQQFLRTIYEHGWYPQTLGFFTPVETAAGELYFFDDREIFPGVDNSFCGFNHKELSGLDYCLKRVLLGWDKGDFLPSPMVEAFEISNMVDAVLLSLFHLLQEQVAIKECKNCKKLFVPLIRGDAIYCDRPAPQDSKKTCKEYGSKVLWYENVVKDDVAKLARNIYCAKQMLAKRNPDKTAYAEMFEHFKVEKKKWEQEVKAGRKTSKEFMEWLQTMKRCKTLPELEEI